MNPDKLRSLSINKKGNNAQRATIPKTFLQIPMICFPKKCTYIAFLSSFEYTEGNQSKGQLFTKEGKHVIIFLSYYDHYKNRKTPKK